MNYQIDFSRESRTDIKALPGNIWAQALELFQELAENPRLPRSKELQGKPRIYRIWLPGVGELSMKLMMRTCL